MVGAVHGATPQPGGRVRVLHRATAQRYESDIKVVKDGGTFFSSDERVQWAQLHDGRASDRDALLHSCTVALLHCCTVALLLSCTVALLHCCTVALLCCCTVALLHCCTVALLHCCTVALLHC